MKGRRCRAAAPVLLGVTLVPQPTVDAAAPTQQNLLERRAEVAVEARVYHRVEEAVCEAEPQEEAGQPGGDLLTAAVLLAERPDQSQDEERQPACSERTHDHTQRLRHLQPQHRALVNYCVTR